MRFIDVFHVKSFITDTIIINVGVTRRPVAAEEDPEGGDLRITAAFGLTLTTADPRRSRALKHQTQL